MVSKLTDFASGIKGFFCVAAAPAAIGAMAGDYSVGFYAATIGIPVYSLGYVLALKDVIRGLDKENEEKQIQKPPKPEI